MDFEIALREACFEADEIYLKSLFEQINSMPDVLIPKEKDERLRGFIRAYTVHSAPNNKNTGRIKRSIRAMIIAAALLMFVAFTFGSVKNFVYSHSSNKALLSDETSEKVSDSLQDQPGSNVTTQKDNNSISSKSKENGVGGATPGLLKFRLIYYEIPRPFADIVGADKCDEWSERYFEGNDGNQGNEYGMAMKAYVQHFDISREDFDKANLKWAKIIRDDFEGSPMMNPKDFANQETDEVFNGDIIYTFDDKIINEYYIGHPDEFYPYWYADEFEKAVEEGYTPRTTDWIDVDKMEADIIAKYGSID